MKVLYKQGCLRGQDPRGRGQDPRGRGQDPRGQGRGHTILAFEIQQFFNAIKKKFIEI